MFDDCLPPSSLSSTTLCWLLSRSNCFALCSPFMYVLVLDLISQFEGRCWRLCKLRFMTLSWQHCSCPKGDFGISLPLRPRPLVSGLSICTPTLLVFSCDYSTGDEEIKSYVSI